MSPTRVSNKAGSAPVELRNRERAPLAIREAPPSIRVDHLLEQKVWRGVVPVAILIALRHAAGLSRTVTIENNRFLYTVDEQALANIFAHLRRTGLSSHTAHTDTGEVGAEFRGPDYRPAHKTRNTPQYGRTMTLDHAHGFVE